VSDETKQPDELASPVSPPNSAPAAAAPPAPTRKSFDVALVDPHNPAVEHWPRYRVTVDAATLDDLTADQKAPPPGGESAEAEARRLAFLVSEIERKRAITAYNDVMGLTDSHLRYDVAAAKDGSEPPKLSKEWASYLQHTGTGH
jgi:hypothetical protein